MHTSQIHHGKGIGTLAVHSAIGLALVILFGCDSGRDQPLAPDNSESGPDGVTTAQLGVSYPASSAQRRLTFDGQMLEIGARVPGFAGMHLDTLTGEIVILLTSAGLPGLTSSQRIADAAIHVRAFLHPSLRTANLKHEPAEYSFEQLKGWHDRFASRPSSIPVTLTDVDEVSNRVLVGVASAGDVVAVTSAASALGIPPDALSVRVMPPVDMDVAPESSARRSPGHLQQIVTPRLGGTQIQYSAGGTFNCTIGFNTLRMLAAGVSDGSDYFVTASHCSGAAGGFGAVTGLTMGQPDLANPVATEFQDPALFTGASDPACPPGRLCRYSDAAVFKYNAGIAVDRSRLAYSLPAPLGFLRFTVTSEAWGWLIGTTFHKTGRTTGHQTGQLTNTCVDMVQFLNGNDTGRTMLCQDIASYGSQDGDSGGPVWYHWGNGNVALVGIHWRGAGGFSPINLVQDELSSPGWPFAYPYYRPY